MLAQLDSLDKGQLEEIVRRVKDMPVSDAWQYSEKKTDKLDLADRRDTLMGLYVGPRSIETLVEFMKAQKLVPKDW